MIRKDETHMRYQIKLRCLQLNIRLKDLILETAKRTGDKITPAFFSSAISGALVSPKAERVLAAADEILTEMEGK